MSTNPNVRFDSTPDDESSKVASRLESECQRLKERSRTLIQGYKDRLGRERPGR